MGRGENEKDGRMTYERQAGVPRFTCVEYGERLESYALLIPVIDEGDRLIKGLKRAYRYRIADQVAMEVLQMGARKENDSRG